MSKQRDYFDPSTSLSLKQYL